MEIKTLKLTEIVPYENNPRNNDNAVEAVAESIKQCGYVAPIIIDENGVILAGHTRYKALKRLGRKEAEVVIRTGLTEEQKKKYRILDNKTGEVATWDEELLNMELGELDFGDFDFGFGELSDGGGGKAKKSDDEDDETSTNFNYSEQYGVIVMCADEAEQEQIYNRLTDEGFTCKVVAV